jgi:hypothetical protein
VDLISDVPELGENSETTPTAGPAEVHGAHPNTAPDNAPRANEPAVNNDGWQLAGPNYCAAMHTRTILHDFIDILLKTINEGLEVGDERFMSKNDFCAKAGTPDRQARLREALKECEMTMEDWGALMGHKFALDGFAHPKTRRGKVMEIITEHIATNVVTEREQKVLEANGSIVESN